MEMMGASIGHDFKQHLAAVRLLAHRIADRELDAADAGMFLEKLGGEIDKLSEFSRRLTKLARPATTERETVPVKDVVEAVTAFLRERVERKRIALVTRFEDPALTAWVDRNGLYQALVNLGVNAIEAMTLGEPEREGRELTIEVGRDAAGLRVVVADNGPGLPPAVLARLFDPFVTEGKTDGDGLGLYLAWDAVTREGGFIHYEPNEPSGTRFLIHLPD